jgi:hypothetical protein
MFKVRSGRATAVEQDIGPVVTVDSARIARNVGESVAMRLWPLSAEVHLTSLLAPVRYPEADFQRVMETLIAKALTASPPEDTCPRALVGSRDDGRTTIFSVHSYLRGAFRDPAPHDGFHDGPDYRTWEARAIVERNGGRFWVDERSGDGATAYFTVPR